MKNASGSLPPSGPWSGYYLYGGIDAQHRMKLHLMFARDGDITGDGIDDIAMFVIIGMFNGETLEANWTKSYIGMHSVAYHGVYNQRTISGTWTLNWQTGSFQIWPTALAESEEEGAQVDVEQPEELVLVTASSGGKFQDNANL